ncbi:MAG: nitroreductase family deazaflavin-dependent oxidoreductase, partial [Gammaproteobacteria bacterium]|nr:nitroreductase family deazaflavin-dependent oxidoreductase [Gammaproteobacteria bacterium]
GLSRILYRLPILFYKFGFGGLMGERFILVNHIGRKSQKQRQAVLEVIRGDSQSKNYYVVSAFGEKSQWYQNLMNHPEVEVQ